jgi:hypothetical protein
MSFLNNLSQYEYQTLDLRNKINFCMFGPDMCDFTFYVHARHAFVLVRSRYSHAWASLITRTSL